LTLLQLFCDEDHLPNGSGSARHDDAPLFGEFLHREREFPRFALDADGSSDFFDSANLSTKGFRAASRSVNHVRFDLHGD